MVLKGLRKGEAEGKRLFYGEHRHRDRSIDRHAIYEWAFAFVLMGRRMLLFLVVLLYLFLRVTLISRVIMFLES